MFGTSVPFGTSQPHASLCHISYVRGTRNATRHGTFKLQPDGPLSYAPCALSFCVLLLETRLGTRVAVLVIPRSLTWRRVGPALKLNGTREEANCAKSQMRASLLQFS
eukprot:4501492-Prymnesium_polylepis.2